MDSVLPTLLAFRSVMVIRNIQLKKAEEKKKLRDKMRRENMGNFLEGNTDPRYMTEFEVECIRIDEKNKENPAKAKSDA